MSMHARLASAIRLHTAPRVRTRRGVVSVIAMMFLVIFGSLSVAMAIMAQGNLRAADSALRVSRATSAAQTGLVFASRRLDDEGRRWVVRQGVIDEAYGADLWLGNLAIDGTEVEVLEGADPEAPTPEGLADAILAAHSADLHAFDAEPGDALLPDLSASGRLEVKPIRMFEGDDDYFFRLRYELVEETVDHARIRVTSEGVDRDIMRRVSMEFVLAKRIEFAVVSPSRIMIGKNVLVEGPLGTRYGIVTGELNSGNGTPLTMRSDFYYLADDLDGLLDELHVAIAESDVDGDGALRPGHSIEGGPIASSDSLIDYDGDQFVTDFDLFLDYFDADEDGRVVWNATRAIELGETDATAEFSGVDDQLARLIDRARPDRNEDGVFDEMDIQLGWDDGVIDVWDRYAKVDGRLVFAVEAEQWETIRELNWREDVQGPTRTDSDEEPALFEAPKDILREITTEMFSAGATWYLDQVTAGDDFAAQVASGVGSGGEAIDESSSDYESVPFNAPNAYDYFRRPIYRGITFENVLIPVGTNARFEDCTFVGVTYIETETDCVDPNWNYAGALERQEVAGGSILYVPKFPGLVSSLEGSPVADTKLYSNNLIFEGCTFLGSIAGDRPVQYTHWRNKLQFTGATRFYIDPTDPAIDDQPDASLIRSTLEGLSADVVERLERSSILLPGWSIDVGNFLNETAADPEDTPVVRLSGVIIAGILDARGTVDVHGTLLLTFRPTAASGPLFYGGGADQFNATLGYFGPLDGDFEGSDPSSGDFSGFGEVTLRYDPDVRLPDGIPWPISIDADPTSYLEGATP